MIVQVLFASLKSKILQQCQIGFNHNGLSNVMSRTWRTKAPFQLKTEFRNLPSTIGRGLLVTVCFIYPKTCAVTQLEGAESSTFAYLRRIFGKSFHYGLQLQILRNIASHSDVQKAFSYPSLFWLINSGTCEAEPTASTRFISSFFWYTRVKWSSFRCAWLNLKALLINTPLIKPVKFVQLVFLQESCYSHLLGKPNTD